jgi:hypothetical protein
MGASRWGDGRDEKRRSVYSRRKDPRPASVVVSDGRVVGFEVDGKFVRAALTIEPSRSW